MLPGDIAGVVMGMGVRAPCNKYALSVSFGSEGFSPALARVFNHVSVLWAYSVGAVASNGLQNENIIVLFNVAQQLILFQ